MGALKQKIIEEQEMDDDSDMYFAQDISLIEKIKNILRRFYAK